MNILKRTWAEVSRSQLAANYRSIREAVEPGVMVAPVVKANAYGHGAVEVSRVLVGEGARWLAVNCVAEGAELRDAGLGCGILVMGGVLPFERAEAFGRELTPVAHSLEELREWDGAAIPGAVHLMVDTGITRLGARAEAGDVVEAVRGLRFLRVEGLMSHFASAERFDTEQTEEQIARFEAVREALSEAGLADAAVDPPQRAGGIVGQWARQQRDRRGDFRWLAQPRDRLREDVGRVDRLIGLAGIGPARLANHGIHEMLDARGHDRARGDRVHGHALGRDHVRQVDREVVHACLGRAVFEQLAERLVAGDRAEIDHPAPAALDHRRHQLLRKANRGDDVDVEAAEPV